MNDAEVLSCKFKLRRIYGFLEALKTSILDYHCLVPRGLSRLSSALNELFHSSFKTDCETRADINGIRQFA